MATTVVVMVESDGGREVEDDLVSLVGWLDDGTLGVVGWGF